MIIKDLNITDNITTFLINDKEIFIKYLRYKKIYFTKL